MLCHIVVITKSGSGNLHMLKGERQFSSGKDKQNTHSPRKDGKHPLEERGKAALISLHTQLLNTEKFPTGCTGVTGTS